MSSVGLFVSAIGLLVASAERPGLRAVAAALVIIEVIAFLRSPLRFFEQITAHQLGFSSVANWRSWLVRRVAVLDYDEYASLATGDVVERALRDTEDLQSLWLRAVLPGVSVLCTFLVGDVAVALFTPRQGWLKVSLLLLVFQLIGSGALVLLTRRFRQLDIERRRARSHFRSRVLEVAQVAPELALLGRLDVVQQRLERADHSLQRVDAKISRIDLVGGVLVVVSSIGALDALQSRPISAVVWLCAVTAWMISGVELLSTLRSAARSAVDSTGGAHRLDDIGKWQTAGGTPWPADVKITISSPASSRLDTSCRRGERLAVTGPSGAGKSTLLRALAGISPAGNWVLRIGDLAPRDIDEAERVRHIAYVPAEPALVSGFVADVVLAGRAETNDVDLILESLLLPRREVQLPEPSRGERARLAVARALATSVDIILLDEPTVGLGARETSAVLNELARGGATVIVATHDPLVMQWCNTRLALD